MQREYRKLLSYRRGKTEYLANIKEYTHKLTVLEAHKLSTKLNSNTQMTSFCIHKVIDLC